MDWRQVDLTMESVFGGDDTPELLPWALRPSHRTLYDDLFYPQKGLIFAPTEPFCDIDFHFSLFGTSPRWYDEVDPYSKMGEMCDRCGKGTNLLNSRYSLCEKCDDEFEMEMLASPQVQMQQMEL